VRRDLPPCPTGLAIYDAVKRELEHPTPPPASPVSAPAIVQPPRVRWEDLTDHNDRCPRCLHWWVTHGAEASDEGCLSIESSMAERTAMSAANDFSTLRYCGCTARPAPGSELAGRLAHEADALRAYERRD
jgi:hypothetical protein